MSSLFDISHWNTSDTATVTQFKATQADIITAEKIPKPAEYNDSNNPEELKTQ